MLVTALVTDFEEGPQPLEPISNIS